MAYIIYCRVYLSFKRQQYSSAQFPHGLHHCHRPGSNLQARKTSSKSIKECNPKKQQPLAMKNAIHPWWKSPWFSSPKLQFFMVFPMGKRPWPRWFRDLGDRMATAWPSAPAAKSLRNWWVVLTKTLPEGKVSWDDFSIPNISLFWMECHKNHVPNHHQAVNIDWWCDHCTI